MSSQEVMVVSRSWDRSKKERPLLLALEVGRQAAIRENDRANQAQEKAALDWLTDD
jgi:hypothetical protein